MAKEPSIRQIKQEKRNLSIEPAPAGMTRRRFLTYLGTGSAALAAASSGVLAGCGETEEQGGKEAGSSNGEAASAGGSGGGGRPPFRPIEPSSEDRLIVPSGYKFDIIRKWGDPVTSDRAYGYNNDYVAYFPIDVLEGGDNSGDGILWVNHEYVDSKWVSDFNPSDEDAQRTPQQVAQEKSVVGGSVLRVRREGDTWTFVQDDRLNRRIDADTPAGVTGPAAGSSEMRMEGKREVVGTLANCGGGVTPWNTVLSCEENFQYYYGESSPEGEVAAPDDEAAADADWVNAENFYPPEHYGWVVEIDPFDPNSRPRKHTWLGRIRHENAAVQVSDGGKVVVYTGHDEEDERIYKFVSSGNYNPDDRRANMELLADGMLYVADFANGQWVALDYENNPIFRENGFASQADVLVRAPEAVSLTEEEDGPPIGTPMDRCEDIEVDPETGAVYCALTNNENHGNFYGQIIRINEADGNPESTEFSFEVFAAGGPQSGFASPDNLAFNNNGDLWVMTNISSSSLNDGIYTSFKNNGAFFMPAGTAGPGGEVFQFASAPVEAELTGPYFTPDGSTLFLAVQHPGEETEDVNNPTSTWPDGDIPRPAVVAITGFA